MMFVWYMQHFSHNYSWILNAGLGNSKVLILGLLEFSYACCYNYSLLVRFGEVKSCIVIKKEHTMPTAVVNARAIKNELIVTSINAGCKLFYFVHISSRKDGNSMEVGPTIWTARISRTKRIVEIISHPPTDQALDYGAIAPLSWNGCTSGFYTSYIRTIFKLILGYI